MLYYVPLESYKERYTMQWSAPGTGWLERNWNRHGLPYKRVDPLFGIKNSALTIDTGLVLDVSKRIKQCFCQVEEIVRLAVNGTLGNYDVIYFDDFWHPGIEALPYTFDQLGIKPRMYAFCHAQSVDEFDFTYGMRHWMRSFEKGIGNILTGIFVNSTLLADLLADAEIKERDKIHVIGHIFSSDEVKERMPDNQNQPKKPQVIFSSRWDTEKNPKFFLAVADAVLSSPHERAKEIEFTVCTSSQTLKSNDPENIACLYRAMKKWPGQITLHENLSKEQYYQLLFQARIQMNTASQDWVSICLLEASVAGCYPIYPYYRSFPQAFRNKVEFLYGHLNVEDAVSKIYEKIFQDSLYTEEAIKERAWIHECHDVSWKRMYNILMGGPVLEVESYV